MLWAGGTAPLWTAANTTLVGLTDRPCAVERSGPPLPPPPPPPPQAASSSARPAHRPCMTLEARLIKLSPYLLSRRMTEPSGDKPVSFFLLFWRRFLKNSHTAGKSGQRIRSRRDVMTASRDAMTQMCHAFLRT